MHPRFSFEDFIPGTTSRYGGLSVEKEPMLAFARAYDAQPMHIDEAAARHSMVGELIASGWYTASLNMRMICDDFVGQSSSMGAPGVHELKWLKPVKAGDTLHGVRHVLDRRPSATKPDRGFVNFRFELFNQDDEKVFEQTNLIMLGRRGQEPMADSAAKPFQPAEPPLPAFVDAHRATLPFFDEVEVGERVTLGERHFSEADIIAFARDFDPQAFHLDVAAAEASIFGGLIASGWQTASGWMSTMVENRTKATLSAMKAGIKPARLGPSPGFTHLRWIKPVYAGDTITYHSGITSKRASNSRPGWGVVNHYNTGTNQKGEVVFSFHGTVFWERHPDAL